MNKREFFNQMAPVWDERYYSRELFRRLDEMVGSFGLSKGDCVLDVGCGTGGLIPSLLKILSPSGVIHAIDFAEEMVKRAKKKFEDYQNVHFILGSVETLPFDEASFNYVICFGAFPHFNGKEKALKEMHRVLKTGGYLFIAHALSSVEIKAHHKTSSPVSTDVLPEEPEMMDMMNRTGFWGVSIIDKDGCYICKGKKELI